ncbi:glycosyltransferase [Leucobacter chromiireducens]|uniref:glycosyltransferase n=1 Tax=Leucobacter chromiireducens TaxID=283877 RepID=UPI000F62C5E0|nr:glycosyltransferase [Leucobacter chromiireducens]
MQESQQRAQGRRRTLFFFTNTFPYSPGEEFIESEIPFLAESFDKVIVVPSFPYLRKGAKRELPENFTLHVPVGLDGSRKNYLDVLAFVLRRPWDAFGALKNALRSAPRVGHVIEDFKLDLFARMITHSIFSELKREYVTAGEAVFYGYWMYAPARVALHTRKRLGATESTIVTRAHGYDVFSERRASNYLPQRELLFRGMDAVHPVSDNGAEYLRAKFPSFAGKVSTRRLGVAAALVPGNADQAAKLVYSCAYFHPVKRIPLLIDALAVAQARDPEIRWAHIGSSAEPSVIAEMERLAAEKLLPGSYEFLGNLSNEAVKESYAARPGSVFINTSSSEGVPVSVMEALAQGFPVIATDVGGNRELIAVELGMFPGLLPADPTKEEIAERILELLAAPSVDYRAYADASLATWRERWSSETNYLRFSAELRGGHGEAAAQ